MKGTAHFDTPAKAEEWKNVCYQSFVEKHPGKASTVHYLEHPRLGYSHQINLDASVDDANRGPLLKLRDVNRDVVAVADFIHATVPLYHCTNMFFPPCKELNSAHDLWHYRIRPCTVIQIQEAGIYSEGEYLINEDCRYWMLDIEINIAQ